MKKNNAEEILNMVNEKIKYAEQYKEKYGCFKGYYIEDIYEDLSIFDWWKTSLSLTQLKDMKKFLENALKFGFKGYVCFKVGASGCAHGMWAHKEETTNGYSPDGDVLYHSFRSGDNYWDAEISGEWLHKKYKKDEFSLKEIKQLLETLKIN